jgi:hypothetical protein
MDIDPPPAVAWTPLTESIHMEPRDSVTFAIAFGTEVELWAVAVGPPDPMTDADFAALAEGLEAAGRASGLFGPGVPVNGGGTWDIHIKEVLPGDGRLHSGVRVETSRSVTIWEELPADDLGAILDEQDIALRFAGGLRLISGLGVITSEQVAPVAAVRLRYGATIGDVSKLGRRKRARHVRMRSDWEHLLAGDVASLPASALGTNTVEIAAKLASELMERVRSLR